MPQAQACYKETRISTRWVWGFPGFLMFLDFLLQLRLSLRILWRFIIVSLKKDIWSNQESEYTITWLSGNSKFDMKYILTAEKTSLSAFATTFQPMNRQGIKISAACESSPLICKNKPPPNSSSFNNRNKTCIQYISIFQYLFWFHQICVSNFSIDFWQDPGNASHRHSLRSPPISPTA